MHVMQAVNYRYTLYNIYIFKQIAVKHILLHDPFVVSPYPESHRSHLLAPVMLHPIEQ